LPITQNGFKPAALTGEVFMGEYLKAVVGHIGTAIFDVLFVAIFSLAPLLLGRLVIPLKNTNPNESYWDFLFNGQLSFFAMGSLATLLLFCFRKKLPDVATLWIGAFAVGCMLFLVALVGFDPTLQMGQSFVGQSALLLYSVVLLLRILADAMKAVGVGDALQAGTDASEKVQKQLSERMKARP
jgi:hypothetical protein